MFESLVQAIRRATGNRFTPLVSLFLSLAAFGLTLLVVLPGTTGGGLEKFHLLTLNVSHIGQEAVSFSPATTSTTANSFLFARHAYSTPSPSQSTISAAQPSETPDSNTSSYSDSQQPSGTPSSSTSTYIDSSQPLETQSWSTSNFSDSTQPTQTSIWSTSSYGDSSQSSETPSSDTSSYVDPTRSNGTTVTVIVSTATATPTTDFSGVLSQLLNSTENDLRSFLRGLTLNVTEQVESQLSADLDTLVWNVFLNVTESLNAALSREKESVMQDVIQKLLSGESLTVNSSTTASIGSAVHSALGSFSAGISTGVTRAEAAAAEGVSSALGLHQFYTLHLRNACFGNFSTSSGSETAYNVTGCLGYSSATSTFFNLISNISSTTTVFSTNISIPALTQIHQASAYLTNLVAILSKTIFTFYLISMLGSASLAITSLLGLLFPSSPALMYANLFHSLLALLFSLAASATVSAFILTAQNIISLFGLSLGLRAAINYDFLILTWTACVLALLANIYVLAVWFFQFRTISVTVERVADGGRNRKKRREWRAMAGPDSEERMIERGEWRAGDLPGSEETVVEGRPAPVPVQRQVVRPMRNSLSRSKRVSTYADF